MSPAPLWGRIPAELRQRPQWLLSRGLDHDKAPLAIGQGDLYLGSSTDTRTWSSFDRAAQVAHAQGLHVGYVLHETDPFACIDLDVKDATTHPEKPEVWTTQEQFNRFWNIIQMMDSYTEMSRSGKGFHIWVRGKIGEGVRRDSVEVYSQERFIICTGNVVLDKPIADRHEMLNNMASQMRGTGQQMGELVELEEEDDDATILERAMTAGNADKFNDLCAGHWQQYGFPSQSEADLALMSMFTFYSQSNEQCRRLFRMTALGQREKANKNNRYLDFTLRYVRARQAQEAAVDLSGIGKAASLVQELNAKAVAKAASPLHVVGNPDPVAPPSMYVAAAVAAPVPLPVAQAAETGLRWPPGTTGAIAQFIYQSAPRPVKEVAIVAALGFLAGVCGKVYHIPQSGLNIYMILVARSAVGKEAMHSGISALMKAASSRAPAVYLFVDFSDFASGPALTKACAANSSFVNVAGEWGRKLKSIAQDDGRQGPMSSLRTVMTNLYQKSGPQAIVGGIQYSNKDQNVQSVSGVSFSMIGETTPGTFYECLTEQMMEDGFLSRFTMVEYEGDRPELNTNPILTPNQALGDAVGELCQHAFSKIGKNESIPVGRTDAAARLMWSFEKECDQEINSTKDESWRQMWNRASLKVMRISSLLAVADSYMNPVVDAHHVEWSLELIRHDIGIMRRKIEGGDVGMGDHTRERKLMKIITDYLTKGAPSGYEIPAAMKGAGIVPRKYLQIRTQRLNSFSQHRAGANAALNLAIGSMIDSGYLAEVAKTEINTAYNFHGKCYRVLSLADYAAERNSSEA